MDDSETVIVYADGSCLGNPGPGGWGVVLIEGGKECDFSGGDPATTNNRMEITAALEALRRVASGRRVILRSDSQLLVNTINKNWKRHKNQDLWQLLDCEMARRKVCFEWVRGHAGDKYNERADNLAQTAARAAAQALACQ